MVVVQASLLGVRDLVGGLVGGVVEEGTVLVLQVKGHLEELDLSEDQAGGVGGTGSRSFFSFQELGHLVEGDGGACE